VTSATTERRSSAATGRLALVVLVGLALGILTSYAQGWLPDEIRSFANSSGPWALVAFALALLAPSRRLAALHGFVALAALLAGYCIATGLRGFTASSALIAFWGAAALVAGPLLGLGAYWVRTDRGAFAAFGAGAMAGVLIGEGYFGLVYVGDTTSGAYWAGEIVVGVALLGAVAAWRLRRHAVLGAIAVALATTVAFVVVYRANLISVLP
jgi:Family of unknown function (DUF6518)